jgi:hypothetical protein
MHAEFVLAGHETQLLKLILLLRCVHGFIVSVAVYLLVIQKSCIMIGCAMLSTANDLSSVPPGVTAMNVQ